MATHHPECPCRLWNLFAEIHEPATGRDIQVEEAMTYFGDAKRLASVVEENGILANPVKRRRLESLVSERGNGL